MLPFDPRQMAMNLISQNPNIANNPNAQELIKVIQNGDSARGQQIADNLCQTYGISRASFPGSGPQPRSVSG